MAAQLRTRRNDIGSRLGTDLGYTPVYMRYNTGRHVSDNGRDLCQLLATLVSSWPVDVDDVALIGHSMGGLVVRSTCHRGQQTEQAWVAKVHDVVFLGSPHLGAPLARWANFAGWALAKTKEPLPFATLMTSRSAGIDDLRYGYLVEDDWLGCDSNKCRQDHRHDVPLLATANHYVISATITRDPHSYVGRLVGDLLVQPASAAGRHRRRQHIPFPVDNAHHLVGLNHFQLLNHPAAYRALRACLDPAAPGTVPAVTAEAACRRTSSADLSRPGRSGTSLGPGHPGGGSMDT